MTPASRPIVSSAEIEIEAPIEVVWDILAAIERWPTWNPDVRSVRLDGPVAEGTAFSWKAGPGTIKSTIVRLDPPQLMTWTGRTLGIDAVHVWRLDHRDGRTLARTEETYSGLVARIFRRPLQRVLDKTLTDETHHLKAEAERPLR